MNKKEKTHYVLKSKKDDKHSVFHINHLPLRIGRNKDNDFVIPSKKISKYHAEIFVIEDSFVIKDLDSKNNTYVNGEMISRKVINPGDCIRFGNHLFNFQVDKPEPSGLEFSTSEFLKKIDVLKNCCLTKKSKWFVFSKTKAKRALTLDDENVFTTIKELQQMHGQLGTLLSISNNLNISLDLDKLLHTIVSELRNVVVAEKIVIYLKKNDKYEQRYSSGSIDTRDTISSTIVNKVVESGEYTLYGNALENIDLEGSNSIIAEQIRSILCVPITFHNELLGVIYMDNSSERYMFDESHAILLSAIAGQAGIAFKNALLIEEIQKQHEKTVEIESLAAIGTFAAEISHQIKNSLVPLQRLETLKTLIGDNKEAMTLVDSLSRSAKRFEEINQSIRRLACPMKIDPAWIDLKLLVKQAQFNCRSKLKNRNVEVKITINDQPRIFVDHIQMEQALSNIIINAAEAFDGKSGTITIRTFRESKYIVISIKDNGSGIAEESLLHIFDLFYTTKKKSGGNGLGLPLCRAVILAHGGQIDVSSAVDHGTEFLIYLPDFEKKTGHNNKEQATE